MKYVTFEDDLGRHEPCVVTFSDCLIHREMALAVKMCGRRQAAHYRAVTAGFYCIRDGEVKVFGKSESLDLKPSPKADIALLRKILQ